MLSLETENKISKLLLSIADAESTVEFSRQTLNNQIAFDSYNLFRLIDTEGKGFIDSVNLSDFFLRHSLYVSSYEIQQIIFNYDSDRDLSLNYTEFLSLISTDKSYSSKNSSYKVYDSIPYDVEFSFIRLLEKEISFIRLVTLSVKDLNLRYDFTIHEAFRALDGLGADNINSDSIRKFLIRNYITPSEQDCISIIKRFDLNKDYRVDFNDFRSFLSSYSKDYLFLSTHSIRSPIRELRQTYYSPIKKVVYCSPRRCYSPLRYYYSPLESRKYITPIRIASPIKVISPKRYYISNSSNSFINKQSSPKRIESPERIKTENKIESQLKTPESQSIYQSSNKISYEEELFIGYLKELFIVETSLEENKNELSLKSDYNIEVLFTIFERFNKNYISENDFKEGLNNYFGLFPTFDEIALLFKRYDNEKNLSLG